MRSLIAWIAFVAASAGAAGYNPRRRLADSSDCTCDKELEVTVRTDEYPGDTSWTVTGEDCSRSGALAERNDYADPDTIYVDKITLCEGGAYKFDQIPMRNDPLKSPCGPVRRHMLLLSPARIPLPAVRLRPLLEVLRPVAPWIRRYLRVLRHVGRVGLP